MPLLRVSPVSTFYAQRHNPYKLLECSMLQGWRWFTKHHSHLLLQNKLFLILKYHTLRWYKTSLCMQNNLFCFKWSYSFIPSLPFLPIRDSFTATVKHDSWMRYAWHRTRQHDMMMMLYDVHNFNIIQLNIHIHNELYRAMTLNWFFSHQKTMTTEACTYACALQQGKHYSNNEP